MKVELNEDEVRVLKQLLYFDKARQTDRLHMSQGRVDPKKNVFTDAIALDDGILSKLKQEEI